MKIGGVAVGVVVLVVAYTALLPPHDLTCDVGLGDVSVRLERSCCSAAYTVYIDASPERASAMGLPTSAQVSDEALPVVEAILREAGVPESASVGSREFRESYCSAADQ